MSWYRRNYVPGGTYFFTVVTYRRREMLVDPLARRCLRESFETIKQKQKRFWEHTCRDEDDLKRCVDYVHWNAKKHGLVESVADWPWSSFHRFVKLGEYPSDWGSEDPTPGYDAPEWE